MTMQSLTETGRNLHVRMGGAILLLLPPGADWTNVSPIRPTHIDGIRILLDSYRISLLQTGLGLQMLRGFHF